MHTEYIEYEVINTTYIICVNKANNSKLWGLFKFISLSYVYWTMHHLHS